MGPEDQELYRAVYCGLCRTMRKRCGFLAPFVLNFDFAFLSALLLAREKTGSVQCLRCHMPPFKKRCMYTTSASLETAADESVILTYWQLRDKVADSGFFAGLPVRLFCCLFSRTYRVASARCSAFDRSVREHLAELHKLEEEHSASIDRTADTFAQILCASVPLCDDPAVERATKQLLYHMGRWIYLIDARDDLQSDRKTGNYNPLLYRYQQEDDMDRALSVTLDHSVNLMRSSAVLLEFGAYGPLVWNVLEHGIPTVQKAVFDGQWSKIKNQKTWRMKHE